MAAKALVQTRIDVDVKEQATQVLENMGLTVSDAVRIFLTRTAKEGALPIELLSNSEAHDAWFRAKVRGAGRRAPRPRRRSCRSAICWAARRSASQSQAVSREAEARACAATLIRRFAPPSPGGRRGSARTG